MTALLPLWAWGLVFSGTFALAAWLYLRAALTSDRSERLGKTLWPILYAGLIAAMAGALIIGFSIERWWWHTFKAGIVEWTTIWLQLGAAVCFGVVAWRSRKENLNLLAVAGMLLAIVIAGEEAAWGQEVLGFETPAPVSAVNTQDEFTIHNLQIRGMYLNHIIQPFGPLVVFSSFLLWQRWFPRAALVRAGFRFNGHIATLLLILAGFILISTFPTPRIEEPIPVWQILLEWPRRYSRPQEEIAECVFAGFMFVAGAAFLHWDSARRRQARPEEYARA